jgi:hypothetical protein
MTARTTVLTLLALTATTIGLAAPPTDFCARLTVAPVGATTIPEHAEISAREVTDVELRLELTGDVTGDHLLEVKLITPNGHHYETLTVPITTSASRAGSSQKVPTYPHPLPVQQLTRLSRDRPAYEAKVVFPVGGTAIVTSSLYGRWKVAAYLDGTPASCEILNGFWLKE